MEPGSKNWLLELIGHHEQALEQCGKAGIESLFFHDADIEDFAYRVLHSTGLVFGYPIGLFVKDHPQMGDWGDKDSIKLIFAESMINLGLFRYRDQLTDALQREQAIEFVLSELLAFYDFFAEEQDRFAFNKLFRQESSAFQKVERIFDLRLAPISLLKKNFWAGVQYNVFLFIDLLLFVEYLKTGSVPQPVACLRLKKMIIEVVLCGIRANGELDKREEVFFRYFLSAAELPVSDVGFYMELLGKGLARGALQVDEQLPLLQKKVIVEICLIAILADDAITGDELQFLDFIATKIGLPKSDLEFSILFTESFLLKNADKILYLKNTNTAKLLGKSLNKRIAAAIIKNKANISKELAESKELMELLWKSQNTSLSDEERAKVKEQLTDLVKTIPSLAIFLVPGGSVLLPLLLKILPEEIVMPSSFRNVGKKPQK